MLLLVFVTMASFHAVGAKVPRDTVYFYDTWGQMLSMTPSPMIVSPVIEEIIPYEFDFFTTTTNDYRFYDHHAPSYFGFG